MQQDPVDYLYLRAQQMPAGKRFLLGIVGAPGAGKTTIAEFLVNELNERGNAAIAAAVPMDGFHLRNDVLDARNLRALKGIPDTFDAEGFVALLRQLRVEPAQEVLCPSFDRRVDEPLEGAITVKDDTKIIVIEGNYLLLPKVPWTQGRSLFDEIWYLDSDEITITPRLVERHILGGRTPDAAFAKVQSTDLPNARIIAETRKYAHKVVITAQSTAGKYLVSESDCSPSL